MEIAKEIETSESLRPWRWYAGALQQHHYATLMLIEVFASPGTDYAKRAWQSLDWIFQVPSCVPHIHKGRWVLEGALGIMKGYLKARKLRYPTLMDERLGTVPSSAQTPTLPQPQVMSNERASLEDMEMTSGTQAMFMDGMSYKYTEQVCNRPSVSLKSADVVFDARVLIVRLGACGWRPPRFCVPNRIFETKSKRRRFPYA